MSLPVWLLGNKGLNKCLGLVVRIGGDHEVVTLLPLVVTFSKRYGKHRKKQEDTWPNDKPTTLAQKRSCFLKTKTFVGCNTLQKLFFLRFIVVT